MLTFDVPLLQPGASAEEAFRVMQRASRSAAVAVIGPRAYLVEAGAAFVAWKRSLPWDIEHVGIPLEPLGGVIPPPPGTGKAGLVQLQSTELDRVLLFSKREVWGHRYAAGPAACYCTQCESASAVAGTCTICSGIVDCA